MKTFVLALIASSVALVAQAADTPPMFEGNCAYMLATKGEMVKTDCSHKWVEPSSHQTYCFGTEEAKTAFSKDFPKFAQMAATNYSHQAMGRGMMKAQEEMMKAQGQMNAAQKQMMENQKMMNQQMGQ